MSVQTPLLTEKQLSDHLNISVKKLQKDRRLNQGIRFVKFGKSVRYRMSDVETYIQKNTQETLH